MRGRARTEPRRVANPAGLWREKDEACGFLGRDEDASSRIFCSGLGSCEPGAEARWSIRGERRRSAVVHRLAVGKSGWIQAVRRDQIGTEAIGSVLRALHADVDFGAGEVKGAESAKARPVSAVRTAKADQEECVSKHG